MRFNTPGPTHGPRDWSLGDRDDFGGTFKIQVHPLHIIVTDTGSRAYRLLDESLALIRSPESFTIWAVSSCAVCTGRCNIDSIRRFVIIGTKLAVK